MIMNGICNGRNVGIKEMQLILVLQSGYNGHDHFSQFNWGSVPLFFLLFLRMDRGFKSRKNKKLHLFLEDLGKPEISHLCMTSYRIWKESKGKRYSTDN